MHVFQGSNRQKKHSYIPRRFGLALAMILTTLLCQISLLAQSAGTFRFSSQDYEVGGFETGLRVETPRSIPGAQITVVREGGATGRVLVDYYTTNSTVTNFNNISGTLVFDDYQMSSSFIVSTPTLIPDRTDTNFNQINLPPIETIQLVLTNARPAIGEDPTRVAPSISQNGSQAILQVMPNAEGYGFNFERRKWRISEQGISYDPTNRTGIARVWVSYSFPGNVSVSYRINWLPPENENNRFPLEPGSDYASPDTEEFHTADYIPVTGTLSWAPGDPAYKSIDIPIINDDEVEFNEDFEVELFDPQPSDGDDRATLGHVWRATVTIMSDDQFGYIFNDGTDLSWQGYYGGEQPAGAVDRTWNPDYFQHTDPPYNSTPGANNTVHAIVAQPDGKTIIGGDFTAVNTRNRNRIARMNNDGSLDRSFNPGTGADGSVNSVVLQPDGRVIIGGGFTSFNGTQRYGIARLQQNGLLDTSFNPGLGANGVIRAMALQNDGKLLIGGDFTMINGTNMNYVARLNSNGTLDTSFNPGVGPNGPVNSLAVYSGPLFIDRTASGGPAEDRFMVDTGSKKVSLTIDYDFLNIPDTLRVYYEGVPIYDSGLVNGTNTVTIPYSGNSSVLEIVMNEGSGFFGTVWFYSLRIDPDVDPRPVIGGSFTEVAGQSRRSVARLNLDGTLDTTFNPGTGADNAVYAVAKQGNKVLMGGGFNSVDERSRNSIARLNEDGSLDTSFDPGLGANDDVYSIKVQEDGKAMIGGLFTSYNSTRRMGLARLDFTGKLDTSFLDTAYNQFAGLPKVYDFEPENFVRAIDFYKVTNYYLTNITILVTNAADTNLVATNILDMVPAVFDRVLIGGKFQRVGGGFTGDNQHNNAAFGLVDDRQP
ncbi:MAG: Calx-beta domain-containing protein, partial [Verrucomicrobiota bacterium]